jgi:hypothetical protein
VTPPTNLKSKDVTATLSQLLQQSNGRMMISKQKMKETYKKPCSIAFSANGNVEADGFFF